MSTLSVTNLNSLSSLQLGGKVNTTIREVLTADRTYYVRTDGSDSNNGLADTAGGAFLTIQKAVDTAATLDISGFTVTIQVADGTYTGAVVLANVVGVADAGKCIIKGNNTTPANVVISTTSAMCFSAEGIYTPWDVKDLKMQTTTSGDCLYADGGSLIRFGNVIFGACAGTHVSAIQRGAIRTLSNYAISGGAAVHVSATYMSYLNINGFTVTITGAPAFSFAFATAQLGSLLSAAVVTFSGSATGTRFYVSQGATGGASYLPGSAPGTGTNYGASPYGLYA